jgi:hypothetical protein
MNINRKEKENKVQLSSIGRQYHNLHTFIPWPQLLAQGFMIHIPPCALMLAEVLLKDFVLWVAFWAWAISDLISRPSESRSPGKMKVSGWISKRLPFAPWMRFIVFSVRVRRSFRPMHQLAGKWFTYFHVSSP